jgi:hypothetical protein
MDQLSIQTIQGYLSVPLIAPERLDELDAKEIASVLTHLDDERIAASEDLGDAWDKPLDEINAERLEEIAKKVFKNMSCAPDDVPSAGSWRRGSWLRWSASSTHNPSPSGGTGPTTRRSARPPSVSAGGGSRESPPAA